MKSTRQAMSTARGVALLRAMEMLRPAAERVSTDPYARAFVNPFTVAGTRLMIASGLSNLLGIEGAMNFAVAREQYIHELIVAEAHAGLDQLVILGAGFDTRAYRIPDLSGIRVFEVDHPVTQAAKRTALRGVVDPPANVAFVPVNFDTDDLGERLKAAGYQSGGRTLFVWQGVIMYLTEAGIDRTLAFIAGNSAAGSAVVFDYFADTALRGARSGAVRFFTWAMGERLTFALPAGGAEVFLGSRGFEDVRDIDGDALGRLYLTGRNARRPIEKLAGIAIARVSRQHPPR